jgi:hypothetical protein
MNWLAKIVKGKPDEFVHAKLVKYGIGRYPGPRAVIALSQGKIAFKADFDHERVFVEGYLKFAPAGFHKVSGTVVTYTDRRPAFGKLTLPLSWSKSKGEGAPVFKAKLSEAAPIEHLRALLDVDDPTTFLLLSMSPRDGAKPWSVTTKSSFPKAAMAKGDSGKSEGEGAGGEEGGEEGEGGSKQKDPTFCKGAFANTPETLSFVISETIPELMSEVTAKSKSIEIEHQIVIDKIIAPEDDKLPFSEKRRLAKKTGKLVRKITIDGKTTTKEYPFTA